MVADVAHAEADAEPLREQRGGAAQALCGDGAAALGAGGVGDAGGAVAGESSIAEFNERVDETPSSLREGRRSGPGERAEPEGATLLRVENVERQAIEFWQPTLESLR